MPSDSVPPSLLRFPPFAGCSLWSWRRCQMSGAMQTKRVLSGALQPPKAAYASTHASTQCACHTSAILLLVFLSPSSSRSSFVWKPCDAHGKKLTEPTRQPEFPLPAGLGGRRDLLLAVLAILALLATRGVAYSTRAAHLRTLLLGFLDACARIGLDIEVGMRR